MITSKICESFKQDLFNNVHNFNDEYKMCLFDDTKPVDKYMSSYYQLQNEIVGNGYDLGGKTLNNFSVYSYEDLLLLNFSDVIWERSSIKAFGALIYNNSTINKNTLCVIQFGYNKNGKMFNSSYGTFQLEFELINNDKLKKIL